MKPIGILYATHEGQTEKIVERVRADLVQSGRAVAVQNLRKERGAIDLSGYSAVILAAPVHLGKHDRALVNFVKGHRGALDALPNAFLSVSLSEAGVERSPEASKERVQSESAVRQVIEQFIQQTGWRPQQVKAVAGALRYSKYNLLMRFVMKRIARGAGGDTDTSRDYEYTDWNDLHRFSQELAGVLSH